MLTQTVVNFINNYQDLIEDEQWEELLQKASEDMMNTHVKELVNTLQDTLSIDLGDIQWKLLYQYMDKRIKDLKFIMPEVLMWAMLDKHIFYGLDFNDVKFGLLDDSDCEWKEIKLSNGTYTHKLLKWQGKKV